MVKVAPRFDDHPRPSRPRVCIRRSARLGGKASPAVILLFVFLLVIGAAGYVVADYWQRRHRHEEMNEILADHNEEVASDGETAARDEEVVFAFEGAEGKEESDAETADARARTPAQSAGEE